MTDREYIKSDMKAFMKELLESLKGEGYSPYLKSKDNPQGKTDGLTSKTLNKILMKIAKGEDNDEMLESLRDWFKKEKWVRISSSGNIAGPCGTSKNKKNPDRCLPRAKAQSLTKAQRAATARKKKRAGAKGKTVVKNTKAATVKKENFDKVSGGIPYKIVNNQAIISEPLDDATKERIIKRAEKHGYNAKPNMGGGVTIFKETANPQDGKAAPFGSGYKPTKKMKEEKEISKKQVVKLRDMIKSLRKSSKGHAGQADYLANLIKQEGFFANLKKQNRIRKIKKDINKAAGRPTPQAIYSAAAKFYKKFKEQGDELGMQVAKKDLDTFKNKIEKQYQINTDEVGKPVNEAMTKERLLAVMKNQDDAIVRLFDGTEYVVYSPYSDNKDNAEMWGDDSVIGIDRDGGEREFRYDDIDDVSIYRTETKGAPPGHYFTKSGNLVKGRLTKDKRERGARLSDPKDKQRSKIPPVTQYNEEVLNSILEKCWKGYEKKGMKTMFGKRVPNCVKKEDIRNLVVGIIHEMRVDEKKKKKDDRCTRRAKREYDTWPSAYASGAVVRCRRGEIWKK